MIRRLFGLVIGISLIASAAFLVGQAAHKAPAALGGTPASPLAFSPAVTTVPAPADPIAVTVEEVQGPGTYEATGATLAYRIVPARTSCHLEVGLSLNYQGSDIHNPPTAVDPDVVYSEDMGPYDGAYGDLGFYPVRGETDLLENDHVVLDVVRCTNAPTQVRSVVSYRYGNPIEVSTDVQP